MERFDDRPVGVFDSGVGGLSVVAEIRRLLPHEAILYAADSAHCPYGDLPAAAIRARAMAVVGALRDRGAKVVVVACNTACAIALSELRAAFPETPIVGLVPAVKPAAARSRSGRIAVLATTRTIRAPGLAALVREHAAGVEATLVPAPGLVELVEQGVTDGPEVEARLRPILARLRERGADVVVLGCTHYPFLRPALARLLGPEVAVVDSGEAIARRLRDVLAAAGRAAAEQAAPDGAAPLDLVTTGDPATVGRVVEALLQRPVRVGRLDA